MTFIGKTGWEKASHFSVPSVSILTHVGDTQGRDGGNRDEERSCVTAVKHESLSTLIPNERGIEGSDVSWCVIYFHGTTVHHREETHSSHPSLTLILPSFHAWVATLRLSKTLPFIGFSDF